MSASILGNPTEQVLSGSQPHTQAKNKPASIKILFFYPDYGQNGGIERTILMTATQLKEQGVFQPVVVCSKNGPLFRALASEGIRTYGLPTSPWFLPSLRRSFDFTTWAQLEKIVEREKPDIAHVHAGLIENLWFRRWRIPLIYHFHGYGTLYSQHLPPHERSTTLKRNLKLTGKRLIRWMFQKTSQGLDALIFVSDAEKNRMVEEGYLKESYAPMTVIHNGVKLSKLQHGALQGRNHITQLKESLDIPAQARVISFINRLDNNKNPRHFISLARHLVKQAGFEDLHFLMVGDGPLAEALKPEMADLPHLHCLGHRDDVPELLGISDLLVYPSRREGFGLGLVEAMATGVPSLAYASEGACEVLSGFYNTIDLSENLAPIDDISALSLLVKKTLKQTAKERRERVIAGLLRAQEFSLERYMTKLETVYNGLCPKISIILPVYQGEKTILGAINSVLKQTYPHFELLVIDDGSSDGTLDVLQTIDDPRLKVISKANAGVAAARNTGFSESTGEYIAFIDADDRWLSDKLESEVAILREHAKPGESPVCLVYSAYEAVDENNRLIFRPPIRTQSGDLAKAVIEDEGIFLPSTTLLHRTVYDKVGGFNGECHHEDRAFFILACQHFPAYPTCKRLTLYRQTTAGRCRSILKDYDCALSAEESIVEVLKPRLHPEAATRLAMLQRRNLLYRFMMYDCPQNARRLFQHTFAENPDMLSLIQGKKGLLTKVALKTGINFPCQIRKWVQGFNRMVISPFWASQKRIQPILSQKAFSK